jgi:hypothetical protein
MTWSTTTSKSGKGAEKSRPNGMEFRRPADLQTSFEVSGRVRREELGDGLLPSLVPDLVEPPSRESRVSRFRHHGLLWTAAGAGPQGLSPRQLRYG